MSLNWLIVYIINRKNILFRYEILPIPDNKSNNRYYELFTSVENVIPTKAQADKNVIMIRERKLRANGN